MCFFWQWREQIRVHIDLNYIRPIERMMLDKAVETRLNEEIESISDQDLQFEFITQIKRSKSKPHQTLR